jgi:hypothetical protein
MLHGILGGDSHGFVHDIRLAFFCLGHFIYDLQSKGSRNSPADRMRDKIAQALLWGAQHVCTQVQQDWAGFGVQCRYCSIRVRRVCWPFGAVSQFEQRVNIKFMCKFGKSASETQSLTVILHWRNPQFTTGFPGLRMDRRCWRMTSTAGGLWHPEPKKWLKKCDNWFDVIEEWPSRSWSKKLVSLTNPFMRFCTTIWRWDLSVRSLFRGSWPRTEPHIACCAAIPRREKHSCHHPTTVLSESRSEWLLAVPCPENGPH